MDPSIMKLLEEDEDETMHSGAAVEAFTAALNRDIEGDMSTSSHPFDSDGGVVMSQGENSTTSQLFQQWQASSQDKISNTHSQEEPNTMQSEQHSSEAKRIPFQYSQPHSLQPKQLQDNHQQQAAQISHQFSQPTGMQISENPIANQEQELHYLRLQRMNNQPVASTVQSGGQPNRPKQVPFGLLLPVITPQLDKERAAQLHTLYNKLKKNEIPKEGFVRHMKAIVGDQMLKLAVVKLQAQLSQNSSQAAAQQSNLKVPASSTPQFREPQQFPQLQQKGQSSIADPSHLSSSAEQVKSQNREHIQNIPSASFPIYGGTSGTYYGTNANASMSSQVSRQQNMGATQAMNMTSTPKFERQNVVNDSMRVHGGSFPHLKNNSTSSSGSYVKQEPADQSTEQQHKAQLSTPHGMSSISTLKVEQGNTIAGALMEEFTERQSGRVTIPSSLNMATSISSSMITQLDANVSLGSRIPSSISTLGTNAKTPPKKPLIGQKKPLEALGSSPPLASKKQKVSGGFLDQSIDQLNDVTAVSGVNLREEEEQLFSGQKEDSRVSEASRRFVQEEEERLILQKASLHEKMKQIMTKSGVNSISKDVERCMSLSVEERIRGLLSNLIRLSKQRVNAEKSRHQTVVTSDVRHQILMMNRKAREEWDRKQAEAEKLRKLNDPEDGSGTDADKDKDDRGKGIKVNKEEDDKMRTNAANVAARAAVGGDDMLSKWQLMAEQARQKREGGTDGPSRFSQPSKDTQMPSSSSGKSVKENQEQERRDHSASLNVSGAIRKFGSNQALMPHTRVARNISMKDLIAILEREPQMSRSALIYRFHNKMRPDANNQS